MEKRTPVQLRRDEKITADLSTLAKKFPDSAGFESTLVAKAIDVAANSICFWPTAKEMEILNDLGERFPAFRFDTAALLHLALQFYCDQRACQADEALRMARIEAAIAQMGAKAQGGAE